MASEENQRRASCGTEKFPYSRGSANQYVK